jgi:hypothetical protein
MTKQDLLKLLSDAREKLDTLTDDGTEEGDMRRLASDADSAIEDAAKALKDDAVVDAEDHTEHMLRALKHLGVPDLDLFTSADIRMALEQTEGL